MDYPKFILLNQKENYISTQRVKYFMMHIILPSASSNLTDNNNTENKRCCIIIFQFGLSALHVSSMSGSIKQVQILLGLGVDISCKSTVSSYIYFIIITAPQHYASYIHVGDT